MAAVTQAVTSAEAAVDIRGLRLSFVQDGVETEVLRDLDLTIPHGGFVVLVGASGVGKSTLLRVLMGLAQPSAGSVAIHPDPHAERPMALVFQDSRLLPWRRVVRNVEFGLEKTTLSRAERRARAMEVLATVGLANLADRWPWQLSGGQRQRVALARALAVRPSILLMDEPFSALDIATREGLQDQLIQIWQQMNKTILFVTHDIDEAVYLADRVVALAGKPGEIRADRAVTMARPRARNSRSLDDIAALVRADITGEPVSADNWDI